MINAAKLIHERHPDADASEVQRFVQNQFSAMNADPNVVISAKAIAQRYEDAAKRREADDKRITEDIAKLIFRKLRDKPESQNLQLFELAAAFSNATGTPLSDYQVELDEVLSGLEELRYINLRRVGQRMHLIARGMNFEEWGGRGADANDNKGGIVYNYHVSGHNAHFNHNTTDNSTNIVGDAANVQTQLDALRKEVNTAGLAEPERKEALEVVDAVSSQFSSGQPRKSVVNALLTALPRVANVASITSAILALCR